MTTRRFGDVFTLILVLMAGVVGFYAVGHRMPLLARITDFMNRRIPVGPQCLPCPMPDLPSRSGVRS
jgi:hypothetical protein